MAGLADISADPMPMTPSKFGKHIANETEKWAQKALLAKEETVDGMGWIWGFDPVEAWDKAPMVQIIE
jgi:hypothetical protein